MTAPSAADHPLDSRAPVAWVHGARGPFRLAVTLTALTILVILLGAMTTSTGSGLAFADWPLSDGELMPERSYRTLPGFFEHFHRLLAAGAGLLSVVLVVWLFRAGDARREQRIAAVTGLVLVSVQGVIGGLHVLHELPLLSAATHGTLAQVTIAVFAVTAYLLSPRFAATTPAPDPAAGSARKLTVIAVVLLVVQTVIGAIARHSSSMHALWTHVGNAMIVFLIVIIASGLAAGKLANVPGIPGLGRWLMGLLVVQITLGFVALLVRMGKHPENIEHLWRASLISGHVLTGALLTVVATLLAAHVFRGTSTGPGAGRA